MGDVERDLGQQTGASLRDRATRASTEPASGLGHSAGIPSAERAINEAISAFDAIARGHSLSEGDAAELCDRLRRERDSRRSKPVIYLAGPYTHEDHAVRAARFEALTETAAALIRDGHIVYSPITMSHPIDLHFVRDDVHLSSDFWCDFDEAFMSICSEMVILPLEGWETSSGIKREIAYFRARGLPICFLTAPETARVA